jgi:hypothetical protein
MYKNRGHLKSQKLKSLKYYNWYSNFYKMRNHDSLKIMKLLIMISLMIFNVNGYCYKY